MGSRTTHELRFRRAYTELSSCARNNAHYTTLTVAGDDIAHNVTRVEFAAGAAATDGFGDGGVGGGRTIGSTHRILKTLTMQALGGGGGISKYGVNSGGDGGGVGGSTGSTAVSAQTATLAASSASVADASVPSSGVFRLDFMARVSALTALRVHCYGRNYSIPCMHAWTATHVMICARSHRLSRLHFFYGRDCNILCTPHRAQRRLYSLFLFISTIISSDPRRTHVLTYSLLHAMRLQFPLADCTAV
jgi:hypothetical protein